MFRFTFFLCGLCFIKDVSSFPIGGWQHILAWVYKLRSKKLATRVIRCSLVFPPWIPWLRLV